MDSNLVFAIDIGTRKVAGLLIEYIDDKPILKHYLLKEHEQRSMEDGQIHDIPKVAKLVKSVKDELEETTGLKLNEASVAAAGRLLKTALGFSRLELEPGEVLTEARVKALELEAVFKAQKSIVTFEGKSDPFYCVGYSVLSYTIDQSRIKNLIGQKGRLAEVEIIATFLQRLVIDSLTAVLQRAGLEFASLTLEPIAAAHVAIPKDMRRLNLALVDIGAGTSDIAITSDGTITAYGMVSKAGDEVTEHLCEKLLIDFMTAEELKRSFHSEEEEFIYTDIVGFEQIIARSELAELIKEATKEIAADIATEIMRLNSMLPQAVILVGGGSLTPFISEDISKALGLDQRRIGKRGKEVLVQIGLEDDKVAGPILVTPVGIGLSYHDGCALRMHNIYLNGNMQSLLGDNLTIGDALVNAGYSTLDIYGKIGAPLTIYLQGEPLIIPGKRGLGAQINMDGVPAEIDRKIKDGAKIEINKARAGEKAFASLEELAATYLSNLEYKTITWQGNDYSLREAILVNGKSESVDYQLKEGDRISILPLNTVADVLKRLEIEGLFNWETLEQALNSHYYLNGKKISLTSEVSLRLNGKEADLEEEVVNADKLTFTDATKFPKLSELIPSQNEITVITELEGKRFQFQFDLQYQVTVNGEEQILGYRVKNQDDVKIILKNEPLVADILARLSNELATLKTTNLKLTLNGVEAQFSTPIKEGDLIEIKVEPYLNQGSGVGKHGF